MRERFPRFFSRDFLTLGATLLFKSPDRLLLELLVSPLSRLLASLLFWERRLLPGVSRPSPAHLLFDDEHLASEAEFLESLKLFLIENKQSLAFLLASDQSPAQLLRLAEEPAGLFASRLFDDAKRLIASLRREEASTEEGLTGFEDRTFIVPAVDPRELALRRLQTRIDGALALLHTARFLHLAHRADWLPILHLTEPDLLRLLSLARFAPNDNLSLRQFLESLASNPILRKLILIAV